MVLNENRILLPEIEVVTLELEFVTKYMVAPVKVNEVEDEN